MVIQFRTKYVYINLAYNYYVFMFRDLMHSPCGPKTHIFVNHDYVIKWTFYALLAICAGNSSVAGEFPAQRPVMRSFDVLFDLRLNKRLNKQSLGW